MKRACLLLAILATIQAAAAAQNLEFSIRFYDKQIYFPGKSVPIKVSLVNDSPATYRFKLADDKMFSIAFDVRTQTNRTLDAQDTFIRKQTRNQPVFFREMALEPGEEYSFVEDLAEYVKLDQAGMYTVSCRLFPELSTYPSAGTVLTSNTLILSLRPEAGVEPVQSAIAETTGEVLKAEAIPPDEVVRRTIVARQTSHWNEFFLYIDLEEMLQRDPVRKKVWARESDEGRMALVEKYKADLSSSVVDSDIVVLPRSFDILETDYGQTEARVRVLERFAYPSYVEKREYTYFLKRADGIWRIYDYTVTDKGTE